MAHANYKRKLEDFDPNRSDSDDLDYGAQASSPPKRKAQKTKSRKKGAAARPPKKRARKERYNDSDIDADSDEISDEEDSFGEEEEEEEEEEYVERNPRTGRGVRSAAKKPVKYEEPSEEEIEEDVSDASSGSRGNRSIIQGASTTRIVKLKVPAAWLEDNMQPSGAQQTGARATRSRTGSISIGKRGSTPTVPSGLGTRRSSRISHSDDAALQSLPMTGPRSRRGTATPEPAPTAGQRATRGTKGLPGMPSAIMEESQEYSQEISQPDGQAQLIAQLQVAADQGAANTPGYTSADPNEAEEQIQMEQVVEESQEDEDDAPVPKTSARSRATRRKTSSPTATSTRPRRGLRQTRKSLAEVGSDFEPDPEGEDDADVAISSGDDSLQAPRPTSSQSGGQGTRRSARHKSKAGSKSRRQSSVSALDSDEIADEAADLEDDNKRKKRESRRNKASDITYESKKQLRARKEKVDYRMRTLAEINNTDYQDEPGDYQPLGSQQPAAAAPRRRARADREGGYRSLFSTSGPFGGFVGPQPVLGGPHKQQLAGGADSDSSDDEGAAQGHGGLTGATPIKPMQPQGALTGPGGGPPDLGRVKDKSALADADPLGVDTNISFESVGGLDDHIAQLKEMVLLPILYPDVYQRLNIIPPRGVLFHGPPGTGKTMLARAVASVLRQINGKPVAFYMRKGADALSKYVGEAEKQLRLLFEEARKNQPSIIFFDEIDGLAPVRSSKQDQIHASIVSTLLALMDGMDGRGQVIVIGATNRPDSVDPALRRPGRFDREFYFPLPNQAARREIIEINTKTYPGLTPAFKDSLAESTKGYGGADLRALCTEAALNAVQGTFPQIYSSDKKLILDPSQIKVLPKDFMISIDKIVPSSERSAASGAKPLKKSIEPLLRKPLQDITSAIDKAIPRKRKANALEEALYDDRHDENTFERDNIERQFEASRIFRPRLLIKGLQGMGQNYLGGAVLAKLEGVHVQNMGLSTLMSGAGSVESEVIHLFEEVKRHKPSIIYIPDVETWYHTLSDQAVNTFTGLLRSIPPSDPILLLGYIELERADQKPDPGMLRDLFGYSTKNQYDLARPNEPEREEYFQQIIEMIRKSPKEFPDPTQRKRRKLEELPLAPTPPPVPVVLSAADLKAQKRKDRQTLNKLKSSIQPVMDQIKKYRQFVNSPIDDSLIRYLYDEQDPNVLSSDLTEEQRQEQALFRPYEIDQDEKGVQGLREIATGKFYYNLNTTVIEQRLSNGYYKRPKDFTADFKRLAKDAKTMDNMTRTLKANEIVANVDVDMATLAEGNPALMIDCNLLYEREQGRERERKRKVAEARERGVDVPTIVPNVPPPHASHTTTETSGPIVLGQPVPGVMHLPLNTNGTSHNTNGSRPPPRLQDDSEMYDVSPDYAHQQVFSQQQNTHGQRSQREAHTQLAYGSQLNEYQNSASTTTSGQKTSDRSNRSSGPYSNNTQLSNGAHPGDHPNFSAVPPTSGGSQLPDTQEVDFPSSQASASQSSQPMGPPPHRASINNLLNNNKPAEPSFVLEGKLADQLHVELVKRSSGLTVEQLEQVNASIMEAIYNTRNQWNRNLVITAVSEAFNEIIMDIEECQKVLKPSQEV
ncbi:hypothetical protein Q7P37_007344 [Cladosporium fusiforme]